MQISHILSSELHGSPITLSKHEACSFRDIVILIHLLHAGTFRLSEQHLPLNNRLFAFNSTERRGVLCDGKRNENFYRNENFLLYESPVFTV